MNDGSNFGGRWLLGSNALKTAKGIEKSVDPFSVELRLSGKYRKLGCLFRRHSEEEVRL